MLVRSKFLLQKILKNTIRNILKILLFGSEGNVGKGLKKFLKKHHKLICIDFKKRRSAGSRNYINLNLSKKINISKFYKIKSDVGIILSFYKTMPRDFNNENAIKFNSINYKILKNCLRICKNCKVNKIIYFSSAALYSENTKKIKIKEKFKLNAKNKFAKFKLLAENQVLKFGKTNNINSINLRLFNYFDNNGNDLINNFNKQMKKKEIYINGDGNQSRDFLHVYDMSNFIDKLIKTKTKIQTLNLCSGKATKIKKIINNLVRIKNRNIKIIYNKKKDVNFYLVGDNSKLKELTGCKIKNDFNNFLEKL